MTFQTPDLCDENEGKVKVATPMFQAYGGKTRFHGQIQTVKVFEDNVFVRDMLSEPGTGKVLVVDGGGSLRCALVGDLIAAMAQKNGWEGIIVYGCIRDSRAIAEMDLGVFAIDTHPLKTVKRNVGEADIPVTFGGVTFHPGEWLYADDADRSVYAWLRRAPGEKPIAVISNFTPVPRMSHRLGVPELCWYDEISNSDSMYYGGSNVGNFPGAMAEAVPWHGRPYSIRVALPPLSALIFKPKR